MSFSDTRWARAVLRPTEAHPAPAGLSHVGHGADGREGAALVQAGGEEDLLVVAAEGQHDGLVGQDDRGRVADHMALLRVDHLTHTVPWKADGEGNTHSRAALAVRDCRLPPRTVRLDQLAP